MQSLGKQTKLTTLSIPQDLFTKLEMQRGENENRSHYYSRLLKKASTETAN